MKKILSIIGFLLLSGCQSATETEDFYPKFSPDSRFTYQGQKYLIGYAKQNNNHLLRIMRERIMKEDTGFFSVSEASKQEAATVSMDFIRFNICRNGEVKLLSIIEVDRVFGSNQNHLTRYIATFKCQFD